MGIQLTSLTYLQQLWNYKQKINLAPIGAPHSGNIVIDRRNYTSAFCWHVYILCPAIEESFKVLFQLESSAILRARGEPQAWNDVNTRLNDHHDFLQVFNTRRRGFPNHSKVIADFRPPRIGRRANWPPGGALNRKQCNDKPSDGNNFWHCLSINNYMIHNIPIDCVIWLISHGAIVCLVGYPKIACFHRPAK
jgi:hypothetical protein